MKEARMESIVITGVYSEIGYGAAKKLVKHGDRETVRDDRALPGSVAMTRNGDVSNNSIDPAAGEAVRLP